MSRGAPRVELQTTIGTFEVELYTDHAPKTCKNFIELTKRGYYNGTPFHRVIRVRFPFLWPPYCRTVKAMQCVLCCLK